MGDLIGVLISLLEQSYGGLRYSGTFFGVLIIRGSYHSGDCYRVPDYRKPPLWHAGCFSMSMQELRRAVSAMSEFALDRSLIPQQDAIAIQCHTDAQRAQNPLIQEYSYSLSHNEDPFIIQAHSLI